MVIAQHPEVIALYRLSLGKSQRDFARFLNMSQAKVSELERGIGRVNKEKAEEWAKLLSSVRLLSVLELENNRSQIHKRGRFFGEYAKKMALKSAENAAIISATKKKPTPQEQRLKLLFENAGIEHQPQVVFPAQNQKFVVDFVFPTIDNPKVIVEAKELNTSYRKRLSVIDLAYRAIKMKQANPKIKMIAIIDTNGLLRSSRKRLSLDYDYVLINPSDNLVVQTLREVLAS